MAESRKVVTIVFADVTGSTALGEQLDPEAMRRVMERYFAEMRTVLERHGGTVEKFIGDAVMAVFGIPTVHEDDALRAVRAAAEMRARLEQLNTEFEGDRGITIAVRTGVNTGEVVAGDPSQGQAFATGDAVNVAARLEQAAEPGEILLGPLTRRLAGEAVRIEPVEPLELKGKAEPVEAWRLVEVLPDVPAYTRRIDAPFVGRERELAALRAAYERARESSSCELVTVTGPAGIGKSRLVRELVTSVGDEPRVLVGRCLSYGEGITYWPLAEMVRQVAGAEPRAKLAELLGSEPDGALATERLLAAVGTTDESARTEEIFWATRILFERLAAERPLVVVVDDIHWAEQTLLDLVEYLVGFVRAPLVVACTARSELFDAHPHWPRAGLIELEALDDGAAEALIAALLEQTELSADVRDQIRKRAEGNPLFVEQMLALAAENGNGDTPVPATIQALLGARLDHLVPDERDVLVRGAVEGRLFHRGAVSALSPAAENDGLPGRLLTLTRKSFLRPDESLFPGDDAFRFVHVLVRDSAYEAAPKALRADLHERYAAWLESKAAARLPELEEIVGYHLEQSYRYRESLGEPADDLRRNAGERLAAAGERAARRGDYRATANLLERALQLLPMDDPKTLELSFTLGSALADNGKLEEAQALYQTAAESARRLGLETRALSAEIKRSHLSVQTDPSWSAEEARALVLHALPVLEAANDVHGLASAWRLTWLIESMLGRLAAAQAAAKNALEYARQADDPGLISDASAAFGAATWWGYDPLTEFVSILDEQLDWARRTGHRVTEGEILVVAGRSKLERREREDGWRLIGQGLDILRDLGLLFRRSSMEAWFTWSEFAREPQSVVAKVRSFYDLLKSAGETGVLSTQAGTLAMMLARLGEVEEAERLSRESEHLGSPDDLVTQIGWRIARGMVLARQGKASEAETVARSGLELALSTEYASQTAEAHMALADVLRLAGRTDEAAEELERALAIYERKEFAASADAVRTELADLRAELGSSVP